MKKLTLSILAAAVASLSHYASAVTIRMECPTSPGGKDYCSYVKARFEKTTGDTLEFVELPAASDEKLALLQQLFAAKDEKAVDVFQSDTIWIGLLDKHTLDLTDEFGKTRDRYFKGAWNNDTLNGRLKALPFYLDVGMLYYRKDLLEKYQEQPPKTWEELTRIATKIQDEERKSGRNNFWGMVFQGKSYEGLTCNALEWINSSGGGTFVDEKGNITINNPQAAKILDLAASWIGKITPKGALGYKEEESRAVFQNGDALFMRNWPYAYQLSQGDDSPLRDKVGIMPLPSGEGGESSATLGGWQWSVNANTQNKAAVYALLKIVADDDAQKVALKTMGFTPSNPALYKDKEVLATAPQLALFAPVFDAAIARPATPTRAQYPKVSNAIFNQVFQVLNGNANGQNAVVALEKRLQRIKGQQWR
ncbi:ABC transporter substrate-binding protein [[Pantoea] beijingensis]|uniref:ABC transporter substrate-binding protein n=1 Tax=[Pantoea] beijingensis TaxID=1324864 RepID=A0A443IAX1_9GAMM|nr:MULTISPECIES: ABC transporter substrate-binding protein [Erwiniaceae]RWR01371.1 ABC transporter substrate-binding protein [[Pantoea] beijingensis]